MKHLGCTETTNAELLRDYGVTLVEVACVHGFRWVEGREDETWGPRAGTVKGTCRCGKALPSGRSVYCSEKCNRAVYGKGDRIKRRSA